MARTPMSTTIAEEWFRYQNHFALKEAEGDTEHAFYMGCLRMLQWSQKLSRADLIEFAHELDQFLGRDDACICAACKAQRDRGEMYTLVTDLFGTTK